MVKFLRVNFVADKKLAVDIIPIKRKFLVACNCILSKAKCMDNLIKLSLMESHCLPILTYATVSMKWSHSQINDLNAWWNSVYRRTFGFNRWESVRIFISGLGRLDFCHIRMYLCLKFFCRRLVPTYVPFARAMKLFFCLDKFQHLCCNTGAHIISKTV